MDIRILVSDANFTPYDAVQDIQAAFGETVGLPLDSIFIYPERTDGKKVVKHRVAHIIETVQDGEGTGYVLTADPSFADRLEEAARNARINVSYGVYQRQAPAQDQRQLARSILSGRSQGTPVQAAVPADERPSRARQW